ncbi:MAG: sacsin N-terminal ATP-binding-like domain-containing protein [Nakamurella sp.]
MPARPDPADPFGTGVLRSAALATWTASPARFREDANAEEALSRGYAGRVLVELAANAVDAARQLGEPAAIRITLRRSTPGPAAAGELRIANTGARLTEAGVGALASLRASAKRDIATAVGHFGVGFTAVLAISSSPRVISTGGGVAFSADRTSESVAALGIAALDRELAVREGVVPTLRLCWPAADDDAVPAGYTTEVRLPLNDGLDGEQLLQQWGNDIIDHLFWALPGLHQVDVDGRIVTRRAVGEHRVELDDSADGTTGFTVVGRTGKLPTELLAGLPVEERGRVGWQVSWVLSDHPLTEPSPLCAPTPTAEMLGFPARLVGTFEVDETRKHLANSPVDDYLLDRAAAAYLDLVGVVPADRRDELVPDSGFPAGDVDGRLRTAVLGGWRVSPLLLTAIGEPVSPADAAMVRGIDEPTAMLLAEAIPGLLLAPGSARSAAAMRTLEIRELTIGEAVDAAGSLSRPPAVWRRLYDGLGSVDPAALAGIPVPLADGRQVLGVRGALLPGASAAPLAARAAELLPGLRVVHPDAVHPLLERLGAEPADADALLGSTAMSDEISRGTDDLESGDVDLERLDAVAALVLDLVAAGGRGEPAVLADLILTDVDGEPWPAGGLLLPASPLRPMFGDEDLPTVHQRWLDGWSAQVLAAVGVRDGLLVIAVGDRRADDLLPDLDEWLETVPGAADIENAMAVTDLDLIDAADWPALLALLAADRPAREALLSRPSYTGWWLRRHLQIDGKSTAEFRLPGADELTGLYDPLPIELDPMVATAIGVAPSMATTLEADPQAVLDRFCDPDRSVPAARVPALTSTLAGWLTDRDELDLPATMRTLDSSVDDADQVTVPDGPWWAQLLPPSRLAAPGADPAATADAFGLDLASSRWPVSLGSAGSGDTLAAPNAKPVAVQQLRRWAQVVTQAFGISGELALPRVVAGLSVQLGDADAIPVRWWPAADGTMLVDGSAEAVADALALAAGRYRDRLLARSAVSGDAGSGLVESAFG